MPEPTQPPTAKKESVGHSLLVALLVSLVCSALVASSAVLLAPRQRANANAYMRQQVLAVAGIDSEGQDLETLFENVRTRIVDLETGEYVDDVDAERFDPREAATDPELSVAVPPPLDSGRIGRRAKWARVYTVEEQGSLRSIILPVYGYGLWSTMYGLIALRPDGNGIAGITFYEHGETPGLGDQIADPSWQALWEGKQLFDASGELKIEVVKGRVPANDRLSAHHVDGISGATLTGNGVTKLLRYWMGEHAYGPYLKRLQTRGDGS